MFTHQPSLWYTNADAARLRALVAQGEPTAAALFAESEKLLRQAVPETVQYKDLKEQSFLDACCIHYLVTGEVESARKLYDYIMEMTAVWPIGELQQGSWALVISVAHDVCYSGWTTEQQLVVTKLLVKLARCQREIIPESGNPHSVTNNHWAVAHASSCIAAMAAHGHPCDEDGNLWDMREDIDWARGRTVAFMMHHGDQGLYHEGLGYQCYPATFWLACMLAVKKYDGIDLLQRFPNLRNMAASLYSSAAARPTVSDSDGTVNGIGMKLSWNDDGLGWTTSSAAINMVAIAHPEQRGALRWMFDHLSGVAADRKFCPGWAGWLFTFVNYPYDVPAVDPNGILPNHLTDTRQGLSITRNRYQDADDAIFGCYARVTFVGGHAHDDAGSVRFMALGHDWIMGGGQARGDAIWQSIVTPTDGSRANPKGLGAIIWDEVTDAGVQFGMDLRRPSNAYAERYVAVDYSGACGSPAAVALLDVIDDHIGRDWDWNMTFEPGLVPELLPDGFTLTAADGATLNARFLGVQPAEIELRRTPDSARTFQSGSQSVYPGRPYICAHFPFRENVAIYVVLTVQRGPAPEITLAHNLDVQLGEHRWQRPFGAAIPPNYILGESGTLCRYPAGDKGFTVQ